MVLFLFSSKLSNIIRAFVTQGMYLGISSPIKCTQKITQRQQKDCPQVYIKYDHNTNKAKQQVMFPENTAGDSNIN